MALAACLNLASSCHKSIDLAGTRKIYERWETGWQVDRACLIGPTIYSSDIDTQLQLANLLDTFPGCSTWLADRHEMIPADSRASKGFPDGENAINIWTELDRNEITDQFAGEVRRLTAALRSVRECLPTSCGYGGCQTAACDPKPRLDAIKEVVSARAKLRTILRFANDATVVTTRLDIVPVSPTERHIYQGAEAGRPQLTTSSDDAQGWSTPKVVRGSKDSIVWISRNSNDDSSADLRILRIYTYSGSRWVRRDITDVLSVSSTDGRLDVIRGRVRKLNYFTMQGSSRKFWVTEPIALEWHAISSDGHLVHRLSDAQPLVSVCSTPKYLWVMYHIDKSSQFGTQNGELVRMPLIDSSEVFSLRSEYHYNHIDMNEGIACSDEAVAFDDLHRVCTTTGPCSEVPDKARRGGFYVIGDTLIQVAMQGPFLAVRNVYPADERPARVFRLPPKEYIEAVRAHGEKLIALLDGDRKLEVELPLSR